MIRQTTTRRRAFKPRALTPRDEGDILTESQYLRCTDAPGYVSEIFDGAVHVSPSARLWHYLWRKLLSDRIDQYASTHPHQINFVTGDNDVVVSFRPGPTRPRPDIAAYCDFPSRHEMDADADWADFCPVLVVEVISPRRRRKDIERNRDLFWTAGGIVEYWVLDSSENPRSPELVVHTRSPGRKTWNVRTFRYGQEYSSAFFDNLTINLKKIFDAP